MIDIIAMEHKFSPEDKTRWWGDGEWVNEMDYLEFKYHGYDCKIKRIVGNTSSKDIYPDYPVYGGHFCGYVKIPLDLNVDSLDVHGGITYDHTEESVRWIGFDCAHYDDFMPSMERFNELLKITPVFGGSMSDPHTYKNIDFVTQECKRLVDQLITTEH